MVYSFIDVPQFIQLVQFFPVICYYSAEMNNLRGMFSDTSSQLSDSLKPPPSPTVQFSGDHLEPVQTGMRAQSHESAPASNTSTRSAPCGLLNNLL